MSELPDIDAYVESLERKILGSTLIRFRLRSPFVLRTSLPPVSEGEGRKVKNISRLGKQIVFHLDSDQWKNTCGPRALPDFKRAGRKQ